MPDSQDDSDQKFISQQIEDSLRAINELDDGSVLTGFVLIYEMATAAEKPSCGYILGPPGMTSWRALGLIEWIRRWTITPGPEVETDD